MLTFEQPLLLLLIIPLAILVYLTWRNMSLPYGPRQRALILASRLLLFICIVLALAGTAWAQPVTRQSTVFVGDISASTTPQRTFIAQWINAALQHKRSDDSVGIVATGRNALVEQSVKTQQIDFTRFESTPDTNFTDLAAGLRLAAAILPADSQRHIVLLTDGQQNIEDALQEAQLLQQQGIRLDIVSLPNANGPDARVDGLDAPTQLHTNERFPLHIKLYSSVAQRATLRVYLDSSLLTQQAINLAVGSQELSIDTLAPTAGFHTFRVTLDAPNDTILQNNEASAFINVQGAPRILIVEGTPGSGRNIASALQATHMDESIATPSDVPITLDGLIPYNTVILADVPAVALGDTRMQVLQSFVRDLGHGLVVSGGENSYGIGGYANTPLEQTMPVRMDIPQHKETPSIAVVLIVESLEEQIPINISKEAAKEVVGLLTPHDQVGISAGYGTLSIQMQAVTDKKAIDKSIDDMNPEDPPSYNPDFVNAEQVLLHTNAKIKHVILLGDGDAFDSYQAQVTKMANEHITISTVATNSNSAVELGTMQQIAEWGKGRFYRADNPAVIPQILLQETERAARRSVINETFNPAVVGNHPILTGITGLPSLDGYIATTPKPTAQMVLVSHLDDPVLAVWQYGLGRVAAWTSDALGLWTKNWLSWNDGALWWANVVTWSLPASDNGALNVNGKITNGNAQLTVDIPTGTVSNQQQQVLAHIIAPDRSQQTVTLQPTAPNRWEGSFPASQVGAYLMQVTWQSPTNKLTAATGLVVPYSPEYQTQGTNTNFLKTLAQAGGGHFLTTTDPASAFNQKLAPASASLPMTFWLLALAALLLPLDIAARRMAGLDIFVIAYKWLRAHIRPDTDTTSTAAPEPSPVSSALTSLNLLRTRRADRSNSRTILKDTAADNQTIRNPEAKMPQPVREDEMTSVREETPKAIRNSESLTPETRTSPPVKRKTTSPVKPGSARAKDRPESQKAAPVKEEPGQKAELKDVPAPPATGGSTTSRLLEAKRLREQERN